MLHKVHDAIAAQEPQNYFDSILYHILELKKCVALHFVIVSDCGDIYGDISFHTS